MATHAPFQEHNHVHTDAATGERYPIWVREAMLGEEKTIETISAWRLSPDELIAVNKNEGIVYVTFTGIQPPMQVLNANAVRFEGWNHVFRHPDCFDLYTNYKEYYVGMKRTFNVTSAWQLTPEQLAKTNDETGGIVFLLVVGHQPIVKVSGFNPTIAVDPLLN